MRCAPLGVAHCRSARCAAKPISRAREIATLCDGGAKSIAELTSGTMITRQAVTKHLQVLSKAGLVRGVKAGRTRLWEFEATRLDRARRSLDLIAEQWDQALNRLKTMLESGTGSEPVK